MTYELTPQQKRDVQMLMQEHHYTHEQALLSVLRPRTRVRAPTMEELEQLKRAGLRNARMENERN